MRTPRRALFAVLALAALAACQDATAPAERSPLAGLIQSSQQDSTGTPTPPPTGTVSPGYFRGTVRGPNAPGSGGDTLATSPRIVGVVIRAYPLSANTTGGMQLGELAGQTTTDSQGQFTFPTIPGGDYVITFTPPAASGYQGVWVTGPIHGTSHEWPWWVTLPRS